jgi:hypothetical protein
MTPPCAPSRFRVTRSVLRRLEFTTHTAQLSWAYAPRLFPFEDSCGETTEIVVSPVRLEKGLAIPLR